MSKRLTKKMAHQIGLELWTWCAETGEHKRNWPRWGNYGEYFYNNSQCFRYCPYCEYRLHHQGHNGLCTNCPIYNSYGHCWKIYYDKWDSSRTKKERKYYASLFLQQLEAIDVNKPWNKRCLKEGG